jgi:hypothetical protein
LPDWCRDADHVRSKNDAESLGNLFLKVWRTLGLACNWNSMNSWSSVCAAAAKEKELSVHSWNFQAHRT